MSSTLLFVHIPKTAGTSFRNAVEKTFGSNNICRDYGSDSNDTSEIIKQYIYGTKDFYQFKKIFEESNYSVMSGHFPYSKYCPLFDAQNVVTFVRDPVDRLFSEYLHFKRHKGYKKSLSDFCNQERNINMMSRYLNGMDWTSVGFIGITERYDESLMVLGNQIGINLPVLRENVAPLNQKDKYKIDQSVLEMIKELNGSDISLFREIENHFDIRYQMYKKKLPYTYGSWNINKKGVVKGFACRRELDEPVKVNFICGGKIIDSVAAVEFDKKIAIFNGPRAGYVGFKIRTVKNQSHEKIEVRVADTGQLLTFLGYH